MEMVRSLGASPTPIAWGELYTALQQGVVDGAENNPPSFETSRHYEVCKYYSLDEHTTVPDLLLISYVVWKKLPDDVKKIVQGAANESMLYQKELWKKKTEQSMNIVKEAGVKVIYPKKSLFQKEVKAMHDKYKGTVKGGLLERIKKVR